MKSKLLIANLNVPKKAEHYYIMAEDIYDNLHWFKPGELGNVIILDSKPTYSEYKDAHLLKSFKRSNNTGTKLFEILENKDDSCIMIIWDVGVIDRGPSACHILMSSIDEATKAIMNTDNLDTNIVDDDISIESLSDDYVTNDLSTIVDLVTEWRSMDIPSSRLKKLKSYIQDILDTGKLTFNKDNLRCLSSGESNSDIDEFKKKNPTLFNSLNSTIDKLFDAYS